LPVLLTFSPIVNPTKTTKMPITQTAWGELLAGPVQLYTITNSSGNTVSITNYGATLTSMLIDGAEMMLGYDELAAYLGDQPYYGATIGRYGNRIAEGRFALDGKSYQVPINNGPNALHGGPEGLDKRIWVTKTDGEQRLVLTLISPDGDQGFPGNLMVTVAFTWTDDNALRIDYTAITDRPTVVNLTNHAYFTIGPADTVLDQELTLKASHYVPIDGDAIPTGELADVTDTPFDFRAAKQIGRGVTSDDPQVRRVNGFDHTFVIGEHDGSLREFALLHEPVTGRQLRAFTTEPGVQVFTANFEPGQFTRRDGRPLPTHGAICLETQHFPDSPNQPAFPSTRLDPGTAFKSSTVYRFE